MSLCNSLADNALCTCGNRHIRCCAFWNHSSNNVNFSTLTYTYCALRDSW